MLVLLSGAGAGMQVQGVQALDGEQSLCFGFFLQSTFGFFLHPAAFGFFIHLQA